MKKQKEHTVPQRMANVDALRGRGFCSRKEPATCLLIAVGTITITDYCGTGVAIPSKTNNANVSCNGYSNNDSSAIVYSTRGVSIIIIIVVRVVLLADPPSLIIFFVCNLAPD